MNQTSCFAYPSLVEPTIVVLSVDAIKSLNTTLSFEVDPDPFKDNDHNEEITCSDEQHLKHAVVFSILNHLLNNGYHSFSVDDQVSGVVAKPFVNAKGVGGNLLQVFAFRNCVVNSEGEGVLTVETFCYKMLPLTLPRSLQLTNEAVLVDSLATAAPRGGAGAASGRQQTKKRKAPRCSDDEWESSDSDCEEEFALSSSGECLSLSAFIV
jgi:hypothetical protein